jgi:hypothetical protein
VLGAHTIVHVRTYCVCQEIRTYSTTHLLFHAFILKYYSVICCVTDNINSFHTKYTQISISHKRKCHAAWVHYFRVQELESELVAKRQHLTVQQVSKRCYHTSLYLSRSCYFLTRSQRLSDFVRLSQVFSDQFQITLTAPILALLTTGYYKNDAYK